MTEPHLAGELKLQEHQFVRQTIDSMDSRKLLSAPIAQWLDQLQDLHGKAPCLMLPPRYGF